MVPVEFPEQTTKLAKSQPQYRVLPVAIEALEDPKCENCNGDGYNFDVNTEYETCQVCEGSGIKKRYWKQFTCKYELSDLELAQINLTKSFYSMQQGYGFNPARASVESPFKQLAIPYKTDKDSYVCFVPLSDGTELTLHGENATDVLKTILDTFDNLTADQLFFYEKPDLAIDEQGNIIDV